MPDRSRTMLARGISIRRRMALILAASLLSLGSGCGDDLERYYPLSMGRTWRYHVTLAYEGESVTGEATVANLPADELMGRLGVPQRSEVFGQTVVRFLAADRDGIVEFAQQTGAVPPTLKDQPDYVLKAPLVKGTTWSSVWRSTSGGAVISFPTVKSIDGTRETVMVPAGTFTDCLRVRITGKTDSALAAGPASIEVRGEEWYAPDVGFIKGSFREALNHGERTSELVMVLERWTPAP